MKGWIALDIDGTLTEGMEPISEEVASHLRSLFNEGWKIVLVTGRTFSFAEKALIYCQFPYFFAVQHGADLLEMPLKRVIERYYLPHELFAVLDEIYKNEPENYLVYAGVDRGDFCFYRPHRFSQELLHYFLKLKLLSKESWKEVENFDEVYHFSLVKCLGSERSMYRIKEKLSSNPQITSIVIRDPLNPKLHLNMITHHEATKGKTLLRLQKSLKNKLPIIAAGDDWNDLSLLEVADVKIVIETAPKELLEKADIIAQRPNKRGIIPALQKALSLKKSI